jgi:hypothetical protein
MFSLYYWNKKKKLNEKFLLQLKIFLSHILLKMIINFKKHDKNHVNKH